MSRARSLGQAEQVALHGDNESQDSQLIFQIYAKHFGVGEVRTRDHERDRVRDTLVPHPDRGATLSISDSFDALTLFGSQTSSSPPRDFEISHRDASTSPPAIAARSTPATSPIPNGIAAETDATHERTQDSPNPVRTKARSFHLLCLASFFCDPVLTKTR